MTERTARALRACSRPPAWRAGAVARAAALASVCLTMAVARLAGQETAGEEVSLVGRPDCASGESGILGRVRDAATGVALPTARVTARPTEATGTTEAPATPDAGEEPAPTEAWSTEADPAGDFALCGVAPGPVAVTAEFQGVPAPAETLDVKPAVVVHREIAVPLGPPGRLDGRVLEGEERAPVEGALVTLEPLGIQVLTDSAGTFGIDPIPPAAYRLAIHHAAGLRVDSLEVRPRSQVRFESRLIARDVVLGTARVGPALRGTEERPPEAEAPVKEKRPEGAGRGAVSRAAGLLLDRPLLRRWRADRLTQALTLVPGLELVRRCVGHLSTACGFLPRLASDAGCQEAAVYVDGRRVPAGPLLRLLERLRVEDFASVQVVASGEPLPEEVGEGPAECGAVLVWSSSEADTDGTSMRSR